MKKLKIKLAKLLVGKDYAVIPVKPSKELLISMAIREDHAFGIPHDFNSDEEILIAREDNLNPWRQMQAKLNLTQKEKDSRLVTLSQIHEEVVGRGFYRHGD